MTRPVSLNQRDGFRHIWVGRQRSALAGSDLNNGYPTAGTQRPTSTAHENRNGSEDSTHGNASTGFGTRHTAQGCRPGKENVTARKTTRRARGWRCFLLGITLAATVSSLSQARPGARATVAVERAVTPNTGAMAEPLLVPLRVIADHNLHLRWLLVRDEKNHGGPGRMVPTGEEPNELPVNSESVRPRMVEATVIRPGDRVVIEEHTAKVEAYLEATALGAAAAGSAFEARLRIGARVVRALGIAPGRAVLATDRGARP